MVMFGTNLELFSGGRRIFGDGMIHVSRFMF